jgi:hypothetical protein
MILQTGRRAATLCLGHVVNEATVLFSPGAWLWERSALSSSHQGNPHNPSLAMLSVSCPIFIGHSTPAASGSHRRLQRSAYSYPPPASDSELPRTVATGSGLFRSLIIFEPLARHLPSPSSPIHHYCNLLAGPQGSAQADAESVGCISQILPCSRHHGPSSLEPLPFCLDD